MVIGSFKEFVERLMLTSARRPQLVTDICWRDNEIEAGAKAVTWEWDNRLPELSRYTINAGQLLPDDGRAYDRFMKNPFLKLVVDEDGQDLIEYTLLMAFVALASAALFLGAGGSIAGIWTTSNSQLAAANTQAS